MNPNCSVTKNIFKHLFVLGRPASGKSEFLDFMHKLPDEDRANKFHIGKMAELDDFPWLWEKFEEDDIWEKIIGKRFNSEKLKDGYMNTPEIFDFMMQKLDYIISKKYLNDKFFYENNTLLIEFSRGGECPYASSLSKIRPEIFKDAAIFYVEVTGDESLRRNEARFQEKLKHSILAHKCPDNVMMRYYKNDDWPELTSDKRDGFITIQGIKVPFVTMNNEPESVDPSVLVPRYGTALNKLWELYSL